MAGNDKAVIAYNFMRNVCGMIEMMELSIQTLEENKHRTEAQETLLKHLKYLHGFVEN